MVEHARKDASFDVRTARMLGWHQPEIGHQLARIGKPPWRLLRWRSSSPARRYPRWLGPWLLHSCARIGHQPLAQNGLVSAVSKIRGPLRAFSRVESMAIINSTESRLAFFAEQQPTRCRLNQQIRGKGAALAMGWGRFGGMISPLVAGILIGAKASSMSGAIWRRLCLPPRL